MTELEERLQLAVAIAREVGDLTMRYFRTTDLVVERKADDSPVTRADKEGELLMRERLATACPDDAIIGEEHDDKPGTSGYQWYLDPIDGTHSFVHGVPLFGNMMALEQGDAPVVGVLVFPAARELVYAGAGLGAWWATDVVDGSSALDVRRARVSTTASVQAAAFSTTGLEGYDEAGRVDALARIAASGATTRAWSDCYGHLLVATGRVDVMIDAAMNVWDNAPLMPIVTEADGRFTDLDGVATIHGSGAVSSNGLLHDAALALLRG